MKLISLNAALFEKNNLQLKEFIRSENPDITAFQEVSRAVSGAVNPDLISKTTIDESSPSLEYSFYAPMWVHRNFIKRDFHNVEKFNIEFGGFIEQGYYLRTKFPIYHGNNPFLLNSFQYEVNWDNWPEGDARSVQVTDLRVGDVPTANLRILNYHGIWSRDKKGNEVTLGACQKILKLAQAVSYPVIICGDFNLFPDTPSMKVLSEQMESLVDTFKIKTSRPSSNELADQARNVVDYIFVSPGIKVNNFSVPDLPVSDHLPLILDFDLI